MRIIAKTILLVVLSFLTVSRVSGASGAETQFFQAAEKEYLDADYKGADNDFGEFVQKFPNSARIAEALLYRVQARLKLGNYDGALTLLTANENTTSTLADWYLICHGEALLAKGEYVAAQADFVKLVQQFPGSQFRLAALVNAAVARMRLSLWPQVIDLLGSTNGLFQQTASTNPANPHIIQGYLLLSEAQLAQNDVPAAQQSLQALAASPLDPTNNWKRQFLLCRALVAAGQPEVALQNTTNLLLLAEATSQRSFLAQSVAFHGGLLERLGRLKEASDIYQKNIGAGVPTEAQRQALLKVTDLCLELGRIDDAAQLLQAFLQQFPTNELSDLALLTLGELRLRQYDPSAANYQVLAVRTNAITGSTNALDQAIVVFQGFTNKFSKSSLLGKAQLDLGWCYWLGGDTTNSLAAFQRAVGLLPPSLDQARAMFKVADVHFQLTNYSAAISNYGNLVAQFVDSPDVRTNLFGPTLYQITRAAALTGDFTNWTNALAEMFSWFPGGSYTERALLVTGPDLAQRRPTLARGLWSDFAQSVTNSQLRGELELAIAGTYEEENHLEEAIQRYNTWLDTFTNHPAQSRAEYFRARANLQAHHETNALVQLTNLIARFPSSEYAPLAQWCVADYFDGLGDLPGNLQEAESNYKSVFQNWPSSPLAYPARMMAGRVAVKRQDWENAPGYFLSLANDTKASSPLRAEALFAYGDTLLIKDSTNKIGDYQDAFNAFDLICKNYGTNYYSVLAWGQKAICWLQFTRTATNAFEKAISAFEEVTQSPLADATARSTAEVGLGFALEKLAETRNGGEKSDLFDQALRHYKRVFYDNGFLREGEKPDPFWTRKAGIEAARLAERLQMRDNAIGLYRRLQQMFPPLHFEQKIRTLQSQG